MSFKDITFPAACTPLSVRAQRTKDDFLGSSALAFDMAPALTKAANRSPSMVFSCELICIPLYPDPAYPINTATFRFGFRPSASISSFEYNELATAPSPPSSRRLFLDSSFRFLLSTFPRLPASATSNSSVSRTYLYSPRPMSFL